MMAARVGADIPRYLDDRVPCSRCGRELQTGSNTAKTPTCKDCRQVEPEWATS